MEDPSLSSSSFLQRSPPLGSVRPEAMRKSVELPQPRLLLARAFSFSAQFDALVKLFFSLLAPIRSQPEKLAFEQLVRTPRVPLNRRLQDTCLILFPSHHGDGAKAVGQTPPGRLSGYESWL